MSCINIKAEKADLGSQGCSFLDEVGVVAGELLRLARLGIQRPQFPQRGHLLTQLNSLTRIFIIVVKVVLVTHFSGECANSEQTYWSVRAMLMLCLM